MCARHNGAGLGAYEHVRLVNYLRTLPPDAHAPTVLAALFARDAPWRRDERYLVPVLVDDPLLTHLGDSDDWSDDEATSALPEGQAGDELGEDASPHELRIALRQRTNALLEARMELANERRKVTALQAYTRHHIVGAMRRRY